MLSKIKMVREIAEKLYEDTMTITEMQKIVRPNHSTGFSPVDVVTDRPCRISFNSIPSASGDPAGVTESVKLFYSPDITIAEGSRITVTHKGVTSHFKRSGAEARYASHNEVNLEIFDGWA